MGLPVCQAIGCTPTNSLPKLCYHMKSFTVIALLGLVALSSGLKVQNKFFSHTSSELKAPLNDVLKDIEKEKQDDLNRIEHAKTEQKLKEDEATVALKTQAKQHALNLLQRGHAKITEITGAFKVLSDSIVGERV